MRLQDTTCNLYAWQTVGDYVIEAAENCPVEELRMIGCSHNEALSIIVLQKLQEGIENAADLAHVIRPSTLRPDGIKFVKKVDATLNRDRIEYEPQPCSRL